MRQGSGKIDPVNLIVIVQNGSTQQQFEIPTHGWESGHKLEWIKAEIDLAGITIDKNTKITIKQTQWPAKTANRWFLDNIKITKDELTPVNSLFTADGRRPARAAAAAAAFPLFPHSERCRRSSFAILSPEIFFYH